MQKELVIQSLWMKSRIEFFEFQYSVEQDSYRITHEVEVTLRKEAILKIDGNELIFSVNGSKVVILASEFCLKGAEHPSALNFSKVPERIADSFWKLILKEEMHGNIELVYHEAWLAA